MVAGAHRRCGPPAGCDTATVRRVRVVVEGRVQGVFFRASCADEARRLGLVGWVRNRDDGAVEAALEGDDRAVAAMVRWCRAGPPLATVERVDEADDVPLGETTFRIVGRSAG